MAFVDGSEVILAAARALQAEHDRLALEQAVRNIDAQDERGIQEILEAGFFEQGFGVLREQHYPSLWRTQPGRRSVLQQDSERARCDFVITDNPGLVLTDRLRAAREIETDVRLASGTLFAPLAGRDPPPPDSNANPKAKATKPRRQKPLEVPIDPPPGAQRAESLIGPGDVYWLEIKVVGQFCFRRGVPCPNEQYTSELIAAACDDAVKLGTDSDIVRGGALVVLFCADHATARHDLAVVTQRCMAQCSERGVGVRSPLIEGFAIEERIGNTWCAVGLFEPSTGGKAASERL